MRKWILWLMLLVFCAGTAGAESWSLEAAVFIAENEQAPDFIFEMAGREDHQLAMSCNWLGDTLLSADWGTDPVRVLTNLASPDVNPSLLWREMRDGFLAWALRKAKEPVRGLYSGDLFIRAYEERTFSFGPADWILFLRTFQKTLDTGDPLSGVLSEERMERISARAAEADWRAICRLYEEGSFLTVNLLQKEETVAVFSADWSAENRWILLSGWGENGKDYYVYRELQFRDDGLNQSVILMADDWKRGFLSMDQSNVITWTELSLTREADGWSMLAEISAPVLEQPFRLEGKTDSRTGMPAGTVRLLSPDSDIPAVTVSFGVKKASAALLAEDWTPIRLETLTEDEQKVIEGKIQAAMLPLALKLMEVLPAELILPLMPSGWN